MRKDEFAEAVAIQLRSIERCVERIDAAHSALDEFRVIAIGSLLHSIYGGVENILLRFLDLHSIPRPEGKDNHLRLLNLFLEPKPPLPNLLPEEMRDPIQALRGFRHAARHTYAIDFDWQRMETHVLALHGWVPGWLSAVQSAVAAEKARE